MSCNHPMHDDDCQEDCDFDPYDDEERSEAPLFGCACENPLSVDTVCPSCIAYLQEQEKRP